MMAQILRRLVFLACGLHGRYRSRDCRSDAGVVTGVEAVHRSLDARHCILLWGPAVENKGCGQIRAIRGEAERLATAPAEAADK